jgi:hypothetical protein
MRFLRWFMDFFPVTVRNLDEFTGAVPQDSGTVEISPYRFSLDAYRYASVWVGGVMSYEVEVSGRTSEGRRVVYRIPVAVTWEGVTQDSGDPRRSVVNCLLECDNVRQELRSRGYDVMVYGFMRSVPPGDAELEALRREAAP